MPKESITFKVTRAVGNNMVTVKDETTTQKVTLKTAWSLQVEPRASSERGVFKKWGHTKLHYKRGHHETTHRLRRNLSL